MHKITGTLFIILLSITTIAQQKPEIKWEKFIDKESHAIPAGRDSIIEESKYYLVEITDERSLHPGQGIQIARKLDSHHFIVYFTKPLDKIRASAINSIYPANNYWKLSPPLYSKYNTSSAFAQQHLVIKTRDLKRCKNLLQNEKTVTVLKEYASTNTLIINIAVASALEYLLNLPVVTYVGEESDSPHEESLVLDLNLNVNKVNLVHHQYPQLDGTGLTLSIKEQKFDYDDIDFLGRIEPSTLSATTDSKHATEMATIAAGGGNTSFNSKGVAWAAHLSSSNFDNLLPDPDTYFSSHGITLQNHSYGTIIENFYGAYAEAYDQNVNANPSLLHVFSVGNNGTGTDTVGTYKGVEGFANLTGNFKMAKNIITVSSIDTLYELDPYVSKGPAYDGRLKPELAAYSTVGSSSSAALVSGIAAVLQQDYQLLNGTIPDATLVKAILMNSAEDVGPAGIDFYSGYGSVNADRAIEAVNSGLFFTGTISDGGSQTLNIDVPANAKNLKILLAWNDPAATANSNTALVNDLDLNVSHPGSGTTWLPWVLNSYPDIDSLTQLPTRQVDRLNNVEQITVSNPASGTYDININGFNIPEGPQTYFVVYQWDTQDSFSWTFPTGSDNMPFDGERVSIFRWDNTFEGTSGKLEYSLDNGATWQLIDDNVDLTREYYSWPPPDVYATALARMTIGAQQFATDPFTITRPLKVSVGFNCPDSVLLTWNRYDNIDSYTLYTLGNEYLEPLLQTADTAVVLNKQQYPNTLYSLAPTLSGGKKGLRNLTFNYAYQGVDCYLSSFFALEHQDVGNVSLTLSLGTTYQVSKIIFEREEEGIFEPLEEIDNPTNNVIEILDTEPFQGLNSYRAQIILGNGETIVTENVLVYFLTDQAALLFPNPVDRSQELNIFTKDLSDIAYLTLIDANGQVVLKYELLSDREALPVDNLKPGLYLYTVVSEGINYHGKIIIK